MQWLTIYELTLLWIRCFLSDVQILEAPKWLIDWLIGDCKLPDTQSMLLLLWWLLSNLSSIIDTCKLVDWLFDWWHTSNIYTLLTFYWKSCFRDASRREKKIQCSHFFDDYFQISVNWLMKPQRLEPFMAGLEQRSANFLRNC